MVEGRGPNVTHTSSYPLTSLGKLEPSDLLTYLQNHCKDQTGVANHVQHFTLSSSEEEKAEETPCGV